jgi:hypothetical protein
MARHHSIIYRYITRPGPSGAPESHREIDCCQERHEWKFIKDGWAVYVRDSEVLGGVEDVNPVEPAQSNPNRTEDDGS